MILQKQKENGFMGKKDREEYEKKYHFPDPPVIDTGLPVSFDPEKDMELYSKNMIMGATLTRPINDRTLIGNSNVLVFGSAAAGKTYNYLVPNVLQMNASYIITDPSGEVAHQTGKVLTGHGYMVRILNLCDMAHSNRYNPLEYTRSDSDVSALVDALIKATSREESMGAGEAFFTDAETLLFKACIYYLRDFCEDEARRNFAGMIGLIESSVEVPGEEMSLLDRTFGALPHDSQAWKHYQAFRQASGTTLKSIILSCLVRLQPFTTPEVANLTSRDEMGLEWLGDEKTAIFVVIPQTDRAYTFLASLLYTQALIALYHQGDDQLVKSGRDTFAIPVRLMMDEFASLPAIPHLETMLSTMRHYNISATVFIQTLWQLQQMYPDDGWRTFIGNCSSMVLLGAQDPDTLKYFSKMLGSGMYVCEEKVKNGEVVRTEKEMGRVNMTPDEISRMPVDECIIFMQNYPPVKDMKYPFKKHPYYPQTGIADKTNIFAFENMPEYQILDKRMIGAMCNTAILFTYDPVQVLQNDHDVLELVETIIHATSNHTPSEGEKFFIDAERLLISACIFYVKDCCDDEQKNYAGVMELIGKAGEGLSDLDQVFEGLPRNSNAYKYYHAFRQAAGTTVKPVVISCITRLQANAVSSKGIS